MFKGTHTAIVTPFRNGVVDTEAFRQIIRRQIEAGIDGIVAVGTTGESPTLNHQEHMRVIELAIREGKGKTKIIAGTGSNCTSEAIEMSQESEKLGADALLIVTPYYNKPTQEGLYRHYMEIASSTDLPIILYSIPGRCHIEIAIETCLRLAQNAKNIVAIKEAGGSVDRVSKLRQALPDTFEILSGDDALTIPFMSVGAVGVVSVATNIIPGPIKAMVEAALRGDFREAEASHKKYYPLFRDLFLETNPVPCKAAMAEMGWIADELRLPLVPMSQLPRETLFQTLRSLELLPR